MTIGCRMMDVRLLGLSVRSICEVTPLDDNMSKQLELCVVEASNNIIKHAYPNRDDGNIELFVQIFRDRILFVFHDQGIPMDKPPKATFKELDPNDIFSWSDNGLRMGVYLMQSIMDEIIYKHNKGTNHLTMVKYFNVKMEE